MTLAEGINLLTHFFNLIQVVTIRTINTLSIDHLNAISINRSFLVGRSFRSSHRAIAINELKAWPAGCTVAIVLVYGFTKGILFLTGSTNGQKTPIALNTVVLVLWSKILTITIFLLPWYAGIILHNIPTIAACTTPIVPVNSFTNWIGLHTLILII